MTTAQVLGRVSSRVPGSSLFTPLGVPKPAHVPLLLVARIAPTEQVQAAPNQPPGADRQAERALATDWPVHFDAETHIEQLRWSPRLPRIEI